ncbi:MAG: transcriptional regulator [Firmicutes bacterium]|nr:transcriptional regulator [Bacillota bacterium]
MSQIAGETVSINAVITGEMKPEDIPLAPGVDVNALKAGDTEPMEVVVEVPTGKSKRGWNYQPAALQKIVGEVMSQGLPGFLGHQKAEDVDHQFPDPVTHWVGAIWKDGKAYFRGVIDKSAADLKRWIKGKVVKTVSIFGIPKLQQIAGETNVVDYMPLSIDWTPLGRAGMPTKIVSIGEMEEITGGANTDMTWKEIMAKLNAMRINKEVTVAQIMGEMGLTVQQVAGEMDAKWLNEVTCSLDTLGKLKEALKVSGEMDILAVAKEAAAALEEKRKAGHAKLIDDVVKERVTGEMAQSLVKKMLIVPENATKEQIAGEIDKILADETLKDTFNKLHIDKPAGIGTSNAGDKNKGGMLKARTVSI